MDGVVMGAKFMTVKRVRFGVGLFLVFQLIVMMILSACSTSTGEKQRADVFKASEINRAQEVDTVKILATLPVKVEISNAKAKMNTQILGGVVGALAGGALGASHDETTIGTVAGGAAGAALGELRGDTVLVDGVSLTYTHEGKTMNSVQIGRLCEYELGVAVLISPAAGQTRIQPNAVCS